jgi:hypothetical protein
MELGDLVLRFAQSSGIGESFGHTLAGDSPGQPKLRVVTRVVGFGAMAGRLPAASHYGCDRTGPQIAQVEEVFQEFGSIRFQSIEGVSHGVSFLNVIIRSETLPKKRKTAHSPLLRRAPSVPYITSYYAVR